MELYLKAILRASYNAINWEVFINLQLCRTYDKSHHSIYTKESIYYLIKLKDIVMGIVHLYVYEDHKAILNIIAIRKEYQLSGFGSLSIKKIEQLLLKKIKHYYI